MEASAATAAGVRAAGDADSTYFANSRPELRALVPASARRALDVGCGAGALGGALRAERGIEVAGIELFADAAAQAAERLDDVIVADLDRLEELPYDAGHFDAMICGDVLEHLRDPHRLLRVLHRYLAPGGTLVCSIPNIKHWSVLAPLLVLDRWQYTDAGLLDRTHVHFFTLTEIDAMLTETGFTARAVRPIELPTGMDLSPLLDAVARYGADREETQARLNAYQYLVVAERDDDDRQAGA